MATRSLTMRFIRPYIVAVSFLCLVAIAPAHPITNHAVPSVGVTVTPAATGWQMVRFSLPLPPGFLCTGQTLEVFHGKWSLRPGVRVLTIHPIRDRACGIRSARRVIVTFPFRFADNNSVLFAFRPVPARKESSLPIVLLLGDDSVAFSYLTNRHLPVSDVYVAARLLAPQRHSDEEARVEVVESNQFYLWKRYHLPDPNWPRVIDVRADALGQVAVIAHLQRNDPGPPYAPDFGWSIAGFPDRPPPVPYYVMAVISYPPRPDLPGPYPIDHRSWLGDNRTIIYHPISPERKRGHIEIDHESGWLHHRLTGCTKIDNIPMQQASWRRAEFVVEPGKPFPWTPQGRQTIHVLADKVQRSTDMPVAQVNSGLISPEAILIGSQHYHRDAAVRSMADGDDFGNVTGFSDTSEHGGAFGMNRLNHCAPLFEDGYRSGDRRLVEEALLWCDNFYDQSIWWGPGQTGGTRYNNLAAMGKTPPDSKYMWRSDSAVSFCTKGYDAFFMAYEETGDPRYLEALNAQVAYAKQYLNAGLNYTRNVGDVRDFVRLYRWTGDRSYLDEALRLFRDLRPLLSTGDLFTESGKPIEPNPPYIDDDQVGSQHPYAKPYIIGYALAGLPMLATECPNEPRLVDVIRNVADFLAESQDPLGGWRYPHPRSSGLLLNQAMEHAWQLVQADRYLGPQPKHLDAIERVLRQRILVWKKTGRILSSLSGWERAKGTTAPLTTLYKRPEDRDSSRDYTEGQIGLGSSPPEGIVYFSEVLAYYLQHRPVTHLLAPPGPDEPLGKVLSRLSAK